MTESIKDMVRLGSTPVEAARYSPDPGAILRGSPKQPVRSDYEGVGGRLNVGQWLCEPGAWCVASGADEYGFCQLLDGRVRLIDEAGEAAEFNPDEGFVIAAGFRGAGETIDAWRKCYAIRRIPQVP